MLCMLVSPSLRIGTFWEYLIVRKVEVTPGEPCKTLSLAVTIVRAPHVTVSDKR